MMAWFVQPVLIYLNTPTSWFGIIWTVLNVVVGIAAFYSDRIERNLGMNKMNTLILLILFFFYIVRGLATPILKGYINQLTFSEMRATVLSIRNFIIRLMFAAAAPFVGWLNDICSLKIALLTTGVIVFLPGILFLILSLKKD